MVRDSIDRRRRQLLRIVAAATGVGSLSGASGHSPGGADAGDGQLQLSSRRPGGPMTEFGGGVGPDFVVSRTDEDSGPETTRVIRRGEGAVVFEGKGAAALNYAAAAGDAAGTGTVVAVAPGTYTVERPVRLPSSTWLAGSGAATTLRAGSDLTGPIVEVETGADHTRVSDLRMVGRVDDGRDRTAPALAVGGDVWRPVLEHLVIRDAVSDGVRFEAGPDGAYTYEPTLVDIDVARVGGDGFVFGYTGDLFGLNLYAEACGEYGFTMADAGGTLVHPHAYDSRGTAGIRVLDSAVDLTLVGAHSERNCRHGMTVAGERVRIRNAFVANNSRDDPGRYDGAVLDGACDCLVSESAFVNRSDRDRTQRHGIVETATARNNQITNNLFREHVAAAVDRPFRPDDIQKDTQVRGRNGDLSGGAVTGSIYQGNRGYVTENGGKVRVGDGGQIRHGLDEPPRQYWVQSVEPGVYAHAVGADGTDLAVELLSTVTSSPLEDADVEVTWGARSD